MNRLLLLGLLFHVLGAWAAERQVVTLDDPAGDDNGDGTLVYPQRDGFKRGDLDLVSLHIVHTDATYHFEASFKNPIRNPSSVAGDVGPEPLSQFARRGFYAFNLDIYIDQDRVPGSGNTYTLPGRHMTIAASNAWEKAVILTPRPELMREQLIDAVAESEQVRDKDEVAKRIDAAILFPTSVRVRNRTVTFVVPDAFLAGGRADTDWSIVAFVTGAKTSIAAYRFLQSTPDPELQRLPLGVMQPKAGRPRDSFGFSGVAAPSPVVDLLAPAPLKQEQLLLGATELVGVAWATNNVAATTDINTPVTSIIKAVLPAPVVPASAPQHGSIAERLRQLNDLRTQGLINEQEYAELRRKILAEQ